VTGGRLKGILQSQFGIIIKRLAQRKPL